MYSISGEGNRTKLSLDELKLCSSYTIFSVAVKNPLAEHYCQILGLLVMAQMNDIPGWH